MTPPTRAQVVAQLRLTIRLLEAEEAAREAELDYHEGMRQFEPEYPPPTLDRLVTLRAALAMNRAELALLEAERGAAVSPESMTALAQVLQEVTDERLRHHAKWGEQNHADGTGGSPIAHVLRSLCDTALEGGSGTWAHILGEEFAEALDERQPGPLRKELVQVAAVAVAWIEAIDRRPF